MAATKLKVLAFFNESRGGHATGYYSDVRGIVKDALKVPKFFEVPENEIKVNNLLIGHTRYFTHGSNIKENAHPFQLGGERLGEGNIILLHNGVLSNYNTILTRYGLTSTDYPVDSMAAGLLISREGEYLLKDLTGAMSLAYTKLTKSDGSPDGRLYLQRRTNPLYVGKCKEGLYFSSIESSLQAISCKDIHQLEEHRIYVYDKGELVESYEIPKPTYASTVNWTDYQKTNTTKTAGSLSKTSSTTSSVSTKTWDELEDELYYGTSYSKKSSSSSLSLTNYVSEKDRILSDSFLLKNECFLILPLKKLAELGLTKMDIMSLIDYDTGMEQLEYLFNQNFVDYDNCELRIKNKDKTWSVY